MAVGVVFIALFAAATLAFLAVYEGLVLWVIWGWFMVPLGTPQITLPWAIGLSLIAGLLTNTTPPVAKEDQNKHIFNVLSKPAVILAWAWIAKQFM